MTKLYDILIRSATAALQLQNQETGSMPAGHNGPYFDIETPVRNTSHWLITFLHAYSFSRKKSFLAAAERAITYLCSRDARPVGATFWHRKNSAKDTCNGLMGQAWTIEALVEAAIQLERPELIKLAEEVFLLHPFDDNLGLWQRVSVDGTYLDFDYTFNHQLWFAAAGSMLSKHAKSEVGAQIKRYMSIVPFSLEAHSSGLIRHNNSWNRFKITTRIIKRLKLRRSAKMVKYLTHKEIGYHSFNLYAFSLIRSCYPNHPFWDSRKFRRVLQYMTSNNYKEEIENNEYGYPYNPPGFEVAFAMSQFVPNSTKEQEYWVSRQLQRCYDFKKDLMCLMTKDHMTGSARIYEATRISDLALTQKPIA
ncbi:agl cluster protein AglQ [Romeria aff. gracilis LEGE 07310]|uniref:Agl cluster protein AglQ n=1 Tax=Vasconcelosia minhoensis LEGE 07310 TaxID=915328 RepID=A0A8J7DAD9_9CYAN|nr:agl cluster protein AglQ [Romeria gracilis]MBE9076327.1 agl cluster protein AglQ [Romeria aff. gracilis LEGE 07310]